MVDFSEDCEHGNFEEDCNEICLECNHECSEHNEGQCSGAVNDFGGADGECNCDEFKG